MILNTKTYPKITLLNTQVNTGIYEKDIYYPGFTVDKNTNSFFLPYRAGFIKSNHFNRKTNGFRLEILFHGLNFNAKRIKLYRPTYFIDVHKSELHICDEAPVNNFKSRVHKRRLVFFSYDRYLLYNIGKRLKNFKLPDTYTGKGLFCRTDHYKIKIGKVRNQ